MPNLEKQLQYWKERAAAAEQQLLAHQRDNAGIKAFVKRKHREIFDQYQYFAGNAGRRQQNGQR